MPHRHENIATRGQDRESACSFRVVSVLDAVDSAAAGRWDVPEFQREFVWKPEWVCALADSLWRDYPIGSVLLWQVRRDDGDQPPLWIADGQQRLTALCLMSGREPAWLSRRPDELRAHMRRQFDIRFDISGPRFVAAGEARNEQADLQLIPAAGLMAIDARSLSGKAELERLVRELKAGCCRDLEETELHARLLQASMMTRREMVATIVSHPRREDVLEIFDRLNSRGMKFRRLLLKLAGEEIPAAIRGMKGRYQP